MDPSSWNRTCYERRWQLFINRCDEAMDHLEEKRVYLEECSKSFSKLWFSIPLFHFNQVIGMLRDIRQELTKDIPDMDVVKSKESKMLEYQRTVFCEIRDIALENLEEEGFITRNLLNTFTAWREVDVNQCRERHAEMAYLSNDHRFFQVFSVKRLNVVSDNSRIVPNYSNDYEALNREDVPGHRQLGDDDCYSLKSDSASAHASDSESEFAEMYKEEFELFDIMARDMMSVGTSTDPAIVGSPTSEDGEFDDDDEQLPDSELFHLEDISDEDDEDSDQDTSDEEDEDSDDEEDEDSDTSDDQDEESESGEEIESADEADDQDSNFVALEQFNPEGEVRMPIFPTPLEEQLIVESNSERSDGEERVTDTR